MRFIPHLVWLVGGLVLLIAFGRLSVESLPYQDPTPELLAVQRGDIESAKMEMFIGGLIFIGGVVWVVARRRSPHSAMNATKQLPDVTSTLLGRFSPYLHSVVFDFPTNSLEFQLLDRIEQPTCYRVLRFDRLRELQITPHEPEDTDPNFADSIIGAHRDGDEFHFHTDRFAISFSCDAFHEYDRNA